MTVKENLVMSCERNGMPTEKATAAVVAAVPYMSLMHTGFETMYEHGAQRYGVITNALLLLDLHRFVKVWISRNDSKAKYRENF